MKPFTKYLVLWGVFLSLVIAGAAHSGSIKTWVNETLRYSDLNSNFQHIHDGLRGGSHTAIVNADISASAAIAHSKLATPALVPKAFAVVDAVCAAGTCTMVANSGISQITWSSTGVYVATFSVARADALYAVFATPSSGSSAITCRAETKTTTTFQIGCFSAASPPVVVNANFQVMVLDNL